MMQQIMTHYPQRIAAAGQDDVEGAARWESMQPLSLRVSSSGRALTGVQLFKKSLEQCILYFNNENSNQSLVENMDKQLYVTYILSLLLKLLILQEMNLRFSQLKCC